MTPLFSRLADFDADVYRNILSLAPSAHLFDDLVSDPAEHSVLVATEMRHSAGQAGIIEPALFYSQAIGYPFEADITHASRFGDGATRTWYGALDEATALAETAWHALRQLRAEGITRIVERDRAVYAVRATALLLDLRPHVDAFPWLRGDDYSQTMAVGRRAASQSLPGMLYASARWAGDCLVAFTPDALTNPRRLRSLTYRIDPVQGRVAVGQSKRTLRVLAEAELRPG